MGGDQTVQQDVIVDIYSYSNIVGNMHHLAWLNFHVVDYVMSALEQFSFLEFSAKFSFSFSLSLLQFALIHLTNSLKDGSGAFFMLFWKIFLTF